MHFISKLLIALLLLIVCSCSEKRGSRQNSFYYWQLAGPGQSKDSFSKTVRKHGVDHFYVHYMDIGWNEQLQMPVPVAEIAVTKFRGYPLQGHTPVFFIDNKVFEHISDGAADTLVQRISNVIDRALHSLGDSILVQEKILEVQIDCDWTARTKKKYFLFLQRLKKALPDKQISVTIRMYPYKYPEKTGIPPADRGVLMCYNLGNVQDFRTRNSILNVTEFKKYLRKDRYPLPLDIALPVFGWHAWFRDAQLKGILYDLPEQLPASAFKELEKGRWQVLADTVVQGVYLREGDLLRSEYPTSADIKAAAEFATSANLDYHRIIFYHWNEQLLDRYRNVIEVVFEEY